MRALVLLLLLSVSPARGEDPAVQFGPLRVEIAQVAQAVGWKVTAPILSDGLVGRMCVVRFRLDQGEHHWEESRKRLVSVPQWEETSFYKRSFVAQTFDSKKPVQITFALIDIVDQREIGSVAGALPGEEAPPLVVEKAVVKELGRVVYEGRVDLGPTWERVQRGDKLRGDGVFTDFAHKLPKRPKGYWREFVHPTEGVRGAGPQRVIVGRGGEIFYTPDARKSFIQLR